MFEHIFLKIKANQLASVDLMNDKEIPLQYYSAYHIIQQTLPKDIILIGEGANTMVEFLYIFYLNRIN